MVFQGLVFVVPKFRDEDEKNRKKIRSLDLFVLLDQAKRTKHLGLCPIPHFIFLLDKKNEAKRIKKNRTCLPARLTHARRFFRPAHSKCFAFIWWMKLKYWMEKKQY